MHKHHHKHHGSHGIVHKAKDPASPEPTVRMPAPTVTLVPATIQEETPVPAAKPGLSRFKAAATTVKNEVPAQKTELCLAMNFLRTPDFRSKGLGVGLR
jgi:hypothetical protein